MELRREFEHILLEITDLAQKAAENVRQCADFPEMETYLSRSFAAIASEMSATLARATYIVNHGLAMPVDDTQRRIDRLMARRGSDQAGRRGSDR